MAARYTLTIEGATIELGPIVARFHHRPAAENAYRLALALAGKSAPLHLPRLKPGQLLRDYGRDGACVTLQRAN